MAKYVRLRYNYLQSCFTHKYTYCAATCHTSLGRDAGQECQKLQRIDRRQYLHCAWMETTTKTTSMMLMCWLSFNNNNNNNNNPIYVTMTNDPLRTHPPRVCIDGGRVGLRARAVVVVAVGDRKMNSYYPQFRGYRFIGILNETGRHFWGRVKASSTWAQHKYGVVCSFGSHAPQQKHHICSTPRMSIPIYKHIIAHTWWRSISSVTAT